MIPIKENQTGNHSRCVSSSFFIPKTDAPFLCFIIHVRRNKLQAVSKNWRAQKEGSIDYTLTVIITCFPLLKLLLQHERD
jgi:hypothetical protein